MRTTPFDIDEINEMLAGLLLRDESHPAGGNTGQERNYLGLWPSSCALSGPPPASESCGG
jgi:hypothetical protein